MTNSAKGVYWDACVWLGLINQEADKVDRCQHVISLARAGELQIWTSALSLAEVYKKNCGNGSSGIESINDKAFESYIEQEFLMVAQVDFEVGTMARRLLRQHGRLRKPADAIHLATAVVYDLDEFHTFDEDNLIVLNGSVKNAGGRDLKICLPTEDLGGPLFESSASTIDPDGE